MKPSIVMVVTPNNSTVLKRMRQFCRVVDCVLERQTQTGECITVGLVTSSTHKYLRSKTSRARGEPRQVDSSVREEFSQKYLERRAEEEEESLSLTSEINQICNVLSSLKSLQSYSSHLTQPTPAIINNLIKYFSSPPEVQRPEQVQDHPLQGRSW
jgi:hypothetical protein